MVVNIAFEIVMVHTTVFGCIAVTGNLIDFNNLVNCKSLANYAHFVIQKAVDEMIIGLATGVSTIKMAAAEDFVLKTVEIDEDDMHTEINLIEHVTAESNALSRGKGH